MRRIKGQSSYFKSLNEPIDGEVIEEKDMREELERFTGQVY